MLRRICRTCPDVLLVLLGGLVATLWGCDLQRTVDVKDPKHESVLVVNSEVKAGRPWRVDVSRSVGAFEAGNPQDSTRTVTDATVTVLHNGTTLGQLPLDSLDQYSTRQFTPKPGERYTVHVQAPTLPSVRATDRVPRMPPLRLASEPAEQGVQDYNRVLRLTIDDPSTTNNYYHVALKKRQFIRDSTGISSFTYETQFQTRNPSVLNEMDGDLAETNAYTGNTAVFTDALFDGTEQVIALRVQDELYGDTIRVEYVLFVSALSENAYRFSHTKRLYKRTRDNPFAEPVDVHSNVEGGYGIVAARHTDTLTVAVTPD
ncbi:MAG: DUF4249 domain-containing protein [Salinibacter sp.]|uniref:DUF4249 domain-containing protein n=1 Tax=Salinibacter sp. TaxID=2065818 RepID=UPI0035D3F1BC